MESKRHNKLLKLAINRLQTEISEQKDQVKKIKLEDQNESKFFVTAMRENSIERQFQSKVDDTLH